MSTKQNDETVMVEERDSIIESLYSNTIVFYFRMMASVTGFIGLFLWSIHWFSTPNFMNLSMQLAGCWIFWRGILGENIRREILIGDFSVLIALILSYEELKPNLTGMIVNGPFSSQIYIAIVGIFLVISFVDWSKSVFQQKEESQTVDSSRVQWLLFLLFAGLFIALVAMPFVGDLINPPKVGSHRVEDASLFDLVLIKASKTFSLIWVFVLGTCIGSFINVLIYRMPIGKSVLLEKSHCPQCGYNIKSTDNMPIIGWIRLGGKCRNCQLPISIRYPIVEAIIGFFVVILFYWEPLSGGWNLPIRPQNLYRGFVWIVFYTKWDLIGLFVFHAFMFCTLFTWLMIERDKKNVPAFSFCSALLVVLATTLIWPMLIERWRYILPVLFYPESSELIQSIPLILRSFTSSILGGIMGVVILSITLVLKKTLNLNFSLWHSGIALSLIGFTLGWQAVATIGIIWLFIVVILRLLDLRFFDQQWKLNACLLGVTFIHHLFWNLIYDSIIKLFSTSI